MPVAVEAILRCSNVMVNESKVIRDLSINVLGTNFSIGWGPSVTDAQALGAAEGWSRCVAVRPTGAAEESLPGTPSSPFTAVLNFSSDVGGVGVKHLAADTFDGLAESVTSEVTVTAILKRAGELTMLHACGVATLSGAVIALVAKSGTGKTTASTQLGRSLGYISDETVAIRTDGTVLPYPKPLSIKQETHGAAKLQVGPDELGLQAAPDNPHIKAIALLDRIAGGDYQLPIIEPVPLVDAVLALIPDTSSQAAVVQPLQSLCRLIDSVGGVVRVSYTEARDLADSLAPLFVAGPGASSESSKDWAPALTLPETSEADKASPSRPESLPAGWLRTADAVDAVEIGEDLLVLTETELTKLSGIGPIIWKSARRPVSIETLTARIEAEHGLPEGYEAMLDAAIDGLISQGLLLRG